MKDIDTDRDRVALEDDYLRHSRVLIDDDEYVVERVPADEPRPRGYRPSRPSGVNFPGHNTRVREDER